MRKAWCDICGSELSSTEDIAINKFTLKSSYNFDCENDQININADICEECLEQFFHWYNDQEKFNKLF